MKKKVLLIETNKQHIEVLYSQIEFLLDSGYNVSVAVNKEAYEIDLLKSFDHEVNFILKTCNDYAFFRKIRSFVIEEKISVIILNTLEYSNILLPVFIFLRKMPLISIVHNLNYLINKKVYRGKDCFFNFILKRMHKNVDWFFVLNKPLFVRSQEAGLKKVKYFYPVFFQNFCDKYDISRKAAYSDSLIKIGIQGSMDPERRNYRGLLNAVSELDSNMRKRLRIYLIGNSDNKFGREYIEALKSRDLTNCFIWYQKYLNYNDYFNLLNRMHYMVPLIDKSVRHFQKYDRYSISSTVSLALAFHVPLINSSDYGLLREYAGFTIEYDGKNIKQGLVKALRTTREHYSRMVSFMSQLEEVNWETQRKRYIEPIDTLTNSHI
jgi:hypothetical protein